MKVIIDTPELKIIRDHETVIKTADSNSVIWEAHILKTISSVNGVPHFVGLTSSMGSESMKTLVMDLMPGKKISEGIPHNVNVKDVLSQLYIILSNLYKAGVSHLNVSPDNILCSNDGTVSLIGFSGASIIEPNPMDQFQSSPDMIGSNTSFNLVGPNKTITGSYVSIVKSLGGANATNN